MSNCKNCGESFAHHIISPHGCLCSSAGTEWLDSADVSTMKMKAAAPLHLPNDSATTKLSRECACGIFRGDCFYHKES